MRVELGNTHPQDAITGEALPGPAVTILPDVPSTNVDGTSAVQHGTEASVHHQHLAANPGALTHLPGHEALLRVVRAWQGGPNAHGARSPSFVAVTPEPGENPQDAVELEDQLGNFWGCPKGAPDDVEATHYTINGPPGVGA